MSKRAKVIKLRTYAILSLVFVFILDLVTPLGTAIGVLYLLAFNLICFEQTNTIRLFALICCILIVFNFIVFYTPEVALAVYFNRGISVIAIIITMIITIRNKRLQEKTVKEREEYIKSLERMLTITSHRVRKPVASCLGLMELIDLNNPTKEELDIIISHLKKSATDMDEFTKELTDYIYTIKQQHRDEA